MLSGNLSRLLFKNPVSFFQPFSTTAPAATLTSASKSILDLTFPWVLDVLPKITSPISNSVAVDNFNSSMRLFQLSTTPLFPSHSTSSPRRKLFFFNLISNWGKYFSGTIIPAEFNTSKLPGNSPSRRYALKL